MLTIRMKMKSRKPYLIPFLLMAVCCLCLTLPIEAGAPTTNFGGVYLLVTEITDNRSWESSEVRLSLKIFGDPLGDAKGLQLKISKAVDDTGKDLLKALYETPSPDADRFKTLDQNNSSRATLDTELGSPDRKATMIKEISGVVKLFIPKNDPEATALIKNFITLAGKSVDHPRLQSAGIQCGILTKVQYEQYKKLKDEELTANQEIPEELKIIRKLFSWDIPINENSVIISLQDPNNQVIDLEFKDETGRVIKKGGYSSYTDVRIFSFDKPLPKTASLLIYLNTAKAITTVPFTLTNIPLP